MRVAPNGDPGVERGAVRGFQGDVLDRGNPYIDLYTFWKLKMIQVPVEDFPGREDLVARHLAAYPKAGHHWTPMVLRR